MFGVLKPCFIELGYTLTCIVDVVGELKTEKMAAASRGFLAQHSLHVELLK